MGQLKLRLPQFPSAIHLQAVQGSETACGDKTGAATAGTSHRSHDPIADT